ncbi:MAG: hypothetical protein QM765_28425 [Myxococcales bacterium]
MASSPRTSGAGVRTACATLQSSAPGLPWTAPTTESPTPGPCAAPPPTSATWKRFCDGTSTQCPDNTFKKDETTPCREAINRCDVADYCTGTQAACAPDNKALSGTPCIDESCSGNIWLPEHTCDGSGACLPPAQTQILCPPYVCNSPTGHCTTSCQKDADCTTVCDLRSHQCARGVTDVSCSHDGSTALQDAIGGCKDFPCYLRVTDATPCGKISVTDMDIYIVGATIAPADLGTAVTVVEAGSQTTRLALVDVTIRGAYGVDGNGIFAEGTGSSPGHPDLYLNNVTIGSATTGASNALNAIAATNTNLVIERSRLISNGGAGIEATKGDLKLDRTLIQYNGHAGIKLTDTSFQIQNTIVGRNGLTDSAVGVVVTFSSTGLSRIFRFNTVAGNTGGGIVCNGPTQAATPLLSSLFWNPGTNTFENDRCLDDPSSDIPGGSNACLNTTDTELAFESPTLVGANYHLRGTSPCINKLDCPSDPSSDFDSDSRPQRGPKCDVGADEVP